MLAKIRKRADNFGRLLDAAMRAPLFLMARARRIRVDPDEYKSVSLDSAAQSNAGTESLHPGAASPEVDSERRLAGLGPTGADHFPGQVSQR
jgi:hypothetical protein